MNKAIISALTLAVITGITTMTMTGVAAHSRVAATQTMIRADAAFRDGAYLGRLDAQTGRTPHLTTGRWSNSLDRSSFIAGYRSGYGKMGALESLARQVHSADSSEEQGLRDGIADGARQRSQAQPFQLVRTENYQSARGYSPGDGKRQSYRDAYTFGYQLAFYGSSVNHKQ